MLSVNRLMTLLLLSVPILPGATGQNIWTALRNGDTAMLKQLLDAGADPNVRDDIGATPLMYAAAYGSAADLWVLLDHGAHADDATTNGSTALMYAAGDTAKLEILLKRGANVNSKTKGDFTALAAAAIRGNDEGMRLLLQQSANPRDSAFLAIVSGTHPGCGTVHFHCNSDALRRIVKAAGVEQEAASKGPMAPNTILFRDGSLADPSAAGLPPNQVDRLVVFGKIPALGLAAYYGQVENTRTLLERGANPNQEATRNITPLMMAAGSARPNPQIVGLLIAKGANVGARDADGRTALDWALMQGETETARILRAAGAKAMAPPVKAPSSVNKPRNARTAVALAISKLQAISPESGRRVCTSCHNQSLPAIAVKAAADRGVSIDYASATYPTEMILAEWNAHRDDFLAGRCSLGAFAANVGYGLLAMAEERAPANATTDATAFCLASLQRQDGSWENRDVRPPLSDNSSIYYTALVARGLSTYAPPAMRAETQTRLDRALAYLRSAAPVTTQDEVFKLLGLVWSGVPAPEASAQAKRLLRLQHQDGGWGQLPTMASDAYATGQTLYALHAAGMPTTDPAYRRGTIYLLSTQLEDGTWYVRSRAIAIQPYFESGFPHGKDQFISMAATSWAVVGLSYGL